ncbi:hypothetical protein JXQ31_19395 [candidate division KSB1 bacterium]|nr:hypothetical protein [candidate division KSB1 bacterium]
MKKFLYACLLYIFTATVVQGQSVNLPLDHWGYRFLERCEAKGLIKSFDLAVKPVSREVLAELLVNMETRLQKQPDLFSETDWALFNQLKGDFTDELLNKEISLKNIKSERHLTRFTENTSHVYFDLQGRESIISNRGDLYDPDELLSETTLGGMLRGQLGGSIGFYADARNSLLRGSDVEGESFDVSKGSPVVMSGSNVYRDRATAYFILEKPWLRFEIGRDEFEWGPGSHGGLSINRNMPPSDMIRLSTCFSRFRFTSVHLFLSSSLGPKYLAGHRLDFKLLPGFYLGATETVVYGNRDVEPAYINPLMFYHVAEHHLGDKDNNTMSLDMTLTLLPHTRLYGEFFIDDMTSTKSLTGYFGNKFAFLAGGLWTDVFSISNLDISAEYARIEPFVYAHKDSINIYTHYDKIIGHWLGPNSDSAYLKAGYQFNRDVRLELSFERLRSGSGEANTVDRPENGTEKKFLDGFVESKKLYGFQLIDQLYRDIFVSLSYTYSNGENLFLQPNKNSNDHLARFEVYFNY